MRRILARCVDRDAVSASFCFSATAFAIALVVLWCEAATGVAGEKELASRLAEASLRYLPDDCRIVVRIEVDRLMERELGRQFAGAMTCSTFEPFDLRLEQVERLILGAHAFGGSDASQTVAIVFSEQPLELLEVTSPWDAEKVGRHTMWTKPSNTTMAQCAVKEIALCAVEERIVLMGEPKAVRAVLERDGSAEVSETLLETCSRPDGETDVAAAALPHDRVFPDVDGIAIWKAFAERAESVRVGVDYGKEFALEVTAVCHDEAAAQELCGIGIGAWSLLRSMGLEQQDVSVLKALQSFRCDVDGQAVKASFHLPQQMVQVGSAVTSNVHLPVQPTSSQACPGVLYANPVVPASSGVVAAVPQPSQGAGNVPKVGLPSSRPPANVMIYPHPPTPYTERPAASGASPSVPPPLPQPPPQPRGWDPYATPGSYGPMVPPPASASPYSYPPSGVPCVPPPWSQPTPPGPLREIEISEIVRLFEAEVDEGVIARFLENRRLDRELNADDLIELTKCGASAELIVELIEFGESSRESEEATGEDSSGSIVR